VADVKLLCGQGARERSRGGRGGVSFLLGLKLAIRSRKAGAGGGGGEAKGAGHGRLNWQPGPQVRYFDYPFVICSRVVGGRVEDINRRTAKDCSRMSRTDEFRERSLSTTALRHRTGLVGDWARSLMKRSSALLFDRAGLPRSDLTIGSKLSQEAEGRGDRHTWGG